MMNNRIDDILDIINDDKYRKDWKSLFLRLSKEHPLVSVVRRLGAIYEFKKFMALKVVEKVHITTTIIHHYLANTIIHRNHCHPS
jgi:hypothetical protein